MRTALESGDIQRVLSLFRDWSGLDFAYIDARTKAICCTRGEPQFYEELQLYPVMELLRIYSAWEVTRQSCRLGWLVTASPAGSECACQAEAPFVLHYYKDGITIAELK